MYLPDDVVEYGTSDMPLLLTAGFYQEDIPELKKKLKELDINIKTGRKLLGDIKSLLRIETKNRKDFLKVEKIIQNIQKNHK